MDQTKVSVSKIALLLYVLFSILFIGDYRVRIANDAYDDSPVVYSEFYKNPQNFEGDSFFADAKDYVFASIQNAIPALLYGHLDFPPGVFYYLFLLLQNILLLMALSDLGKRVAGDEIRGIVLGSLTYFCFPWAWNLAWYPNYMENSYPAQFVLAPLTWSACALLDNSPRRFWLWVILGTLIHPSMALYMGAIGCLFFLWQDRSPKNLSPLVIVLALAWLPSFLLRDPHAELISREVYMANVGMNGHLVSLTKLVVRSLIPFFLTLCAFAAISTQKTSPALQRLVFCGLVFFLLAVAAYFIGHGVGIPIVLQLVPLRSSALISLFNTLILLAFFLRAMERELLSDKIASLLTLGSLVLFPNALPWAVSLLPFLREQVSEKTKIRVLIGWGALYLILGRPMRWLGLEPIAVQIRHLLTVGPPNSHTYTLLILASFALGGLMAKYRKITPAQLLTTFVLALFAYHGVHGLRETLSGEKVDLFRAQEWARENTAPGTLFITGQSWRGISHRAAVDPTTIWFPVYTRRKSTLETGKHWNEFFESRNTTPSTLSESDILAFAETFGGSYWVTGEKSSFPKVYESGSYSIYKLPTP